MIKKKKDNLKPINKKEKFNFKRISDREVEWTIKPSLKKDFFKEYASFLKKLKSFKQKVNLVFKSQKSNFFKGMYEKYPKASNFYEIVFEKYFDLNLSLQKKNQRIVPYIPGALIITPIVFIQKLYLTEKLLKDLEKRKIFVNDILENEKVTFKIVDHLIYRSLFKISYQDFIYEIETSLKK